MRPNPDFSDLFAALNAEAAEYLLVGGHALAFHAVPRYTRVVFRTRPSGAGLVSSFHR